MTRKHSCFVAVQLALCGSLLLTGCPGEAGNGALVSGSVTLVEGVEYGTTVAKKPPNEDVVIAKLLELVNHEREARGLDPLELDPVLTRMAESHARDMIERSFFSHTNPDQAGPEERALLEGYVFHAIGENLAAGQNSPEWAMTEWMNSTLGHRENILAAQWKEIGLAVRTGGEHGIYWVQEFGNPP